MLLFNSKSEFFFKTYLQGVTTIFILGRSTIYRIFFDRYLLKIEVGLEYNTKTVAETYGVPTP